ncbi:immunity protein Imm33 domain-containing protein [Sphingomonas sp. UYP23]
MLGSYTIDDPRPIAEEARYTFRIPTENQLLALQAGDLVKLIFRSHPRGWEWDAERMWVTLTSAEGDALVGTLDNVPFDMPQLRIGASISFQRCDIIDVQWNADRTASPPPPDPGREYWDRCLVDACVVAGTSPVGYLYREEPDLGQASDTFPDSGWRIRGTDAAISVDERNGDSPNYVALGAVLNRDDSWLALIDAPVGSRFVRDLDRGTFVACDSG